GLSRLYAPRICSRWPGPSHLLGARCPAPRWPVGGGRAALAHP
nr:hypothetical protein [Tanacetum cinerariifolium]